MLLRGVAQREERGGRVKEKRESTYILVCIDFQEKQPTNQSTMVFPLLFFIVGLLLFYL